MKRVKLAFTVAIAAIILASHASRAEDPQLVAKSRMAAATAAVEASLPAPVATAVIIASFQSLPVSEFEQLQAGLLDANGDIDAVADRFNTQSLRMQNPDPEVDGVFERWNQIDAEVAGIDEFSLSPALLDDFKSLQFELDVLRICCMSSELHLQTASQEGSFARDYWHAAYSYATGIPFAIVSFDMAWLELSFCYDSLAFAVQSLNQCEGAVNAAETAIAECSRLLAIVTGEGL